MPFGDLVLRPFGRTDRARSVSAWRVGRLVRSVALIASCTWACSATTARAATPGTITTIAGPGIYDAGYSGDGSPAVDAQLHGPRGLATTSDGDIVIADEINNVIRLVAGTSCASHCPYGLRSMVKGDIYTVAGTGLRTSEAGPVPAADADFFGPLDVAVDRDGDILIIDESSRVRLLARSDCSADCPFGLASMTRGYVYTIAGNGLIGLDGNGGPATSAELWSPIGIAIDSQGDLFISSWAYPFIQMVAASNCESGCPFGLSSTTAGDIYRVVGTGVLGKGANGVPAATANIGLAQGLAFDAEGDLLIADRDTDVYLVAAASCSYDCQYGLRSMRPGDIYSVAGGGTSSNPGDGGPADLATLGDPMDVAFDGLGDLLIDDAANVVRLVPDVGCSKDCAFGPSGTWQGKGFIYTAAGNYEPSSGGDGGPAASAGLAWPQGIAVDGHGNLLISESTGDRVRLVTAADPAPVCYETGARDAGQDGFAGTHDQEDVVVYAPAGLRAITDVTVVNGTASYPPFSAATNGPVIVTATQTNPSQPLTGYYRATDEDGRYTFCGFHLPSS